MHIDKGWKWAPVKWNEDSYYPVVQMELHPVWGIALLF